MQFKEAGNQIKVLRYLGYSKEKKRSEVKMIGALDFSTLKANDALLKNATQYEKLEIQEYVRINTITRNRLAEKEALLKLPETIKKAAHYLSEHGRVETTNEIHEALDLLRKAMRKHKIKRKEA